MCLGELGRVVERHGDVALVRTNHGTIAASLLLAPHVALGDHVVLHSGQVLSVVGAEEADHAARLRTGDPTPTPDPHPSPGRQEADHGHHPPPRDHAGDRPRCRQRGGRVRQRHRVREVGDATLYTTMKNLVAAPVLLAVAGGVARHRATPS